MNLLDKDDLETLNGKTVVIPYYGKPTKILITSCHVLKGIEDSLVRIRFDIVETGDSDIIMFDNLTHFLKTTEVKPA